MKANIINYTLTLVAVLLLCVLGSVLDGLTEQVLP
jgi:hypothetical protein